MIVLCIVRCGATERMGGAWLNLYSIVVAAVYVSVNAYIVGHCAGEVREYGLPNKPNMQRFTSPTFSGYPGKLAILGHACHLMSEVWGE